MELGSDEERFPLRKAPLSWHAGQVSMSGGVISFAHPMLKRPVDVRVENIAAVAPRDESAADPLLVRDAQMLSFASTTFRAPNVVFILRSPALFDGFKLGADRYFGISARERRQGAEVDVVGVEVDDPEVLIAAVQRQGVPVSSSASASLTAVVGEATGTDAEERLTAITRSRRLQRLAGAAVALVAAGFLSVRLSATSPAERELATTARLLVAALAGAVAAGVVGSSLVTALQRRQDKPSQLGGAVLALALLAGAAGLLVLLRSADGWVGAPFVLAHVAIGAALGGGQLAMLFREVPGPGYQPDPVISDQRPGAWRAVLAVASVSVVALIAAAEPGSPHDLAIARAAVVTEQELPEGWSQCCGTEVYRGPELGAHICGSPDDLPLHTAGFDREFTLHLTAEGNESGHMVHAVFLTPSEAAARREFESIDAPEYAECAIASVTRSASVPVGEPNELIDTSYVRGALLRGAPGIVDRFTTFFDTPHGGKVVYTAFVRMQLGRAIVRMPIITYGGPLTDQQLEPFVDAATRKLQAALDQG